MRILVIILAMLVAAPAFAGPPAIYSRDGKFIGRLSDNPFDPDSVSNQFGRYGSPFSEDSVNNPFGRYGSPFSSESAANPFCHVTALACRR